jgi:hypothetical protein
MKIVTELNLTVKHLLHSLSTDHKENLSLPALIIKLNKPVVS